MGDSNSTLQLVAREGDVAPDVADGARFANFFATGSRIGLNSAGTLAFFNKLVGAGVDTTNDGAIWLGLPNALQLIAREADPAPGLPQGVSFDTLTDPKLSAAGQVAFRATVIGTGVTTDNDTGIWVMNPGGTLDLLAREGDLFDVDDGPGTDLRTIAFLSFPSNGVGETLDPLNRVAFQASFTDGSSGIFVASVPEPAGIVAVSGAALCLRRRRR